jgi:hypothetical protein
MEMWQFVLVVILPLVIAAGYVIIRDRRHPVDHPTKTDDEGWGNAWPR